MSSIAALYSTLKSAKTHNANTSSTTQGSASTQADFAALLAQMVSGSSQAQTAGATATTSTAGSTTTGTTGSLATDLNSLKQALSQGDMSAAQLAFQALQNDLQGNSAVLQASNSHRHHHHHAAATAATQADAAQSTTSTSQTVTPVSV